jgi:hypothetical protein
VSYGTTTRESAYRWSTGRARVCALIDSADRLVRADADERRVMRQMLLDMAREHERMCVMLRKCINAKDAATMRRMIRGHLAEMGA